MKNLSSAAIVLSASAIVNQAKSSFPDHAQKAEKSPDFFKR